MSEYTCDYHRLRTSLCTKDCIHRQPETFAELRMRLCKKYGEPVGSGRHRITFASKRVVIKIPKSNAAISANHSEYGRFKLNKGEPLARCRLVTILGLPVIIMEKLDLSTHWNSLPSWSMSYDCGQVGLDRKGNFKAYDYTV